MAAGLLFLLLAGSGPRPAAIAGQAEAARDAGRTEEAIRLYRRGVAASPKWPEGWWNLGTLLYDRNAWTEAKAAFARFVVLEPKGAPGWAFEGLCEFETHDYGHSLEHLQMGLRLGIPDGEPLAKVARYHAALILTLDKQFESALQFFSQLAVQGTGDRQTVLATGIAGLRMAVLPDQLAADKRELAYETGRAIREGSARHDEQARREFADLIARYPTQAELHDLMGRALIANDPDGALSQWKKELAVSPGHVPARLEIAFEYIKRGQPEAGLPFARDAAKLAPELFAAHNALGQILIRMDDVQGGVRELERARDLAPASPETRVVLASAYTKAGRAADAARERAEFLRLKKERDGTDNGR